MGYNNGYDDGHFDGFKEGYKKGRKAGSGNGSGKIVLYYNKNNPWEPPENPDDIGQVVMTTGDLTEVPTGFFQGWSRLKSVDLPTCKRIGVSAFESSAVAGYEIEFNLPECTTVDEGGLSYTSAESIHLPKCVSVGSGAFCETHIAEGGEVNLPACTEFGDSAFESCDAARYVLTAIEMPSESAARQFCERTRLQNSGAVVVFKNMELHI